MPANKGIADKAGPGASIFEDRVGGGSGAVDDGDGIF